jgi:hypothetical protein
MLNRGSGLVVIVLGALLAVGCGGGSGSRDLSKATVRARAIASLRITRATFAIAGLSRKATRAPRSGPDNRPARLLLALSLSRATDPDYDAETKLYYTLESHSDGSGKQALFADAAHQKAAGSFTWDAPHWNNDRPNQYPVLIHFNYQITEGDFAGDRGTLDATFNDATGNNGKMHVLLTNARGENGVADITLQDNKVSAKDTITLPGPFVYYEDDEPQPDGGMICTLTFPDDSRETIQMQPDGTGTETYYSPDGDKEVTGDFTDNGEDTLSYNDGSSETVNVDTGTDDTASTDSGGDSGGDSGRQVRRRKTT